MLVDFGTPPAEHLFIRVSFWACVITTAIVCSSVHSKTYCSLASKVSDFAPNGELSRKFSEALNIIHNRSLK